MTLDLRDAFLPVERVYSIIASSLDIEDVSHVDLSSNCMTEREFGSLISLIKSRWENRKRGPFLGLRLASMKLDGTAIPWLCTLLLLPEVQDTIQEINLDDWALANAGEAALGAGHFHHVVALCKALHLCRRLRQLSLDGCALRTYHLPFIGPLLLNGLCELNLSKNVLQGSPTASKLTSNKKSGEKVVMGLDAGAFSRSYKSEDDSDVFAKRLNELMDSASKLMPKSIDGIQCDLRASLFATALVSPLAKLERLEMQNCLLTDDVALPIATVLGNNKTIQYLDLSMNKLTSITAIALAASLQVNSVLQELHIGFQNLSVAGTTAILEALPRNDALHTLCMENTFNHTSSDVSETGYAAFAAKCGVGFHGPMTTALNQVITYAATVQARRLRFCRVMLEYPERTVPSLASIISVDAKASELGISVAAPKSTIWTVNKSIWAPRIQETDSRDLYDTPALLGRAFESDWARTQINRLVERPETRAAIKPIIKSRYHMLRELFRYFSAQKGDPFVMSLAQFRDMRKAMGLDSPDKSAEYDMAFYAADSNSDASPKPFFRKLDTRLSVTETSDGGGIASGKALSSVTTVGESVATPPADLIVAANPNNALTRSEMLEAFVRLTIIHHTAVNNIIPSSALLPVAPADTETSVEDSPHHVMVVDAVTKGVEDHLVPAAVGILGIPAAHIQDAYSNLFRRVKMYTEEVDKVLRNFEVVTQKVFRKRMDTPSGFLLLPSWLDMLQRLGVIDGSILERCGLSRKRPQSSTSPTYTSIVSSSRPKGAWTFSEADARLLFVYSIMTVVDEAARPAKLTKLSTHNALTYFNFLEALCRLAESAACPPCLPAEHSKDSSSLLSTHARAPSAARSLLNDKETPELRTTDAIDALDSGGRDSAIGIHTTRDSGRSRPTSPEDRKIHMVKAGGAMVRHHAGGKDTSRSGVKEVVTGSAVQGVPLTTTRQKVPARAKASAVTAAAKVVVPEKFPEAPTSLSARLEILLMHVAVSEEVSLRDVKRLYT